MRRCRGLLPSPREPRSRGKICHCNRYRCADVKVGGQEPRMCSKRSRNACQRRRTNIRTQRSTSIVETVDEKRFVSRHTIQQQYISAGNVADPKATDVQAARAPRCTDLFQHQHAAPVVIDWVRLVVFAQWSIAFRCTIYRRGYVGSIRTPAHCCPRSVARSRSCTLGGGLCDLCRSSRWQGS